MGVAYPNFLRSQRGDMMLLDFSGSKVPAQLISKEEIISKHTGSSLERLEVRIHIKSHETNEHFKSLVSDAQTMGLSSVNEDGNILKRWNIGSTSWNFTEGKPDYYHTIELTEEEELNLTSLEISGLILHPYFYKETFEKDFLEIEAKVVLDEEEHQQIKTYQLSNESFSVVRHGISEQSLEMSLARSPWSKNDTEYKHKLYIFHGKKKGGSEGLASMLFSMNENIAFNRATLISLLDLLKIKNIISEEDLEKVDRDASEKSNDVSYEFNQFEDIDNIESD